MHWKLSALLFPTRPRGTRAVLCAVLAALLAAVVLSACTTDGGRRSTSSAGSSGSGSTGSGSGGSGSTDGDGSSGDGEGDAPLVITPACFDHSTAAVDLQSGDLMSGSTWNDPHLLAENGGYTLYASSDNDFDGNIQVFRLRSTDALNWTLAPSTPVLSKDPDGWDSKSTETPAVVKFQGTYHLFYTGYPDSADTTTWRVGHATSADGITWVRDADPLVAPTDPYGDPNLDFNQFAVAEPGPVVFEDELIVFFTAFGADAGVGVVLQTIGSIRSADGETWSEPVLEVRPDQALYPRETYYGFSTPHAAVIADRLHLFYDVALPEPYQQVLLTHAVLQDTGEWLQDPVTIAAREDFDWTSASIRAPAVLEVAGELWMWFAGHTPEAVLSIGHLRCHP